MSDTGRAGQAGYRGSAGEAAWAGIDSADPKIDSAVNEGVGERLLRVFIKSIVRVVPGCQGIPESTAHCRTRWSGTERPAIKGDAVPVRHLVNDRSNQGPMRAGIEQGVPERFRCIVGTVRGPEQGDCGAPRPEMLRTGFAEPT